MWRDWSTLKKLIWLRFLKAASFIIHTVTGTAPLVLENAIAAAIKSLRQYGKCEQNGTPTPDAPVDIYCNNGAIKAVTAGASTQDGTPTPDNYVPVVGLPCGNTELQGIDTDKDYIDPSTQSIVRVIGKKVFDGTESFGKSTAYGTAWYINGASSAWGANRNKAVLCTHFVGGEASSGSPNGICFFNTTGHFYFRASEFADAAAFKAWVKDQYDAGTPVVVYFVKSTSATEPWDGKTNIITDGTPETLTVRGVNLCNPALYTGDGWYISANNTVSSAASNGTLVFPCKPNATYSWWHTDGKGGGRAFELTTDEVTAGQSATWAVGNPAYNDAMTVRKYTTSANAKLLCVLFARVADQVGRTIDEQLADFMLVEGDITTATNYEPYVAPQTVTDLPTLLSVGNYKDESEIISGLLTHKVGIKVFDGSETFTVSSSGSMITTIPDVALGAQNVPLNTHFALETSPTSIAAGTQRFGASGTGIYSKNYYMKHTSITAVADFQSWLASEYAAGTPVIVLYPLATEIMESGTEQPLTTVKGTNTVSVTSNVDPVELEVEYSASA